MVAETHARVAAALAPPDLHTCGACVCLLLPGAQCTGVYICMQWYMYVWCRLLGAMGTCFLAGQGAGEHSKAGLGWPLTALRRCRAAVLQQQQQVQQDQRQHHATTSSVRHWSFPLVALRLRQHQSAASIYMCKQRVGGNGSCGRLLMCPPTHTDCFLSNPYTLQVQRCTLLSIKTGGCPENCSYCSQSSHWSETTGLKAEKLMDLEPVYQVGVWGLWMWLMAFSGDAESAGGGTGSAGDGYERLK